MARAIATPKDEAPVDGSLFEVDDRDETLETGSKGWRARLLNELPATRPHLDVRARGWGYPTPTTDSRGRGSPEIARGYTPRGGVSD